MSPHPPPQCPRLAPATHWPSSDRFQGDSRLEQPSCYHHCVDENIERRNHYLDLAGIENYTSQFGPGKAGCGRRGQASRYVTIPPGLGEGIAWMGQVQDVIGGNDI